MVRVRVSLEKLFNSALGLPLTNLALLIPNISLTNNTGDSANVVTNLPLPAVETNGVLVADDGTAVQVSVTIDGILKATAALEKSKTFKGSIVYLT